MSDYLGGYTCVGRLFSHTTRLCFIYAMLKVLAVVGKSNFRVSEVKRNFILAERRSVHTRESTPFVSLRVREREDERRAVFIDESIFGRQVFFLFSK